MGAYLKRLLELPNILDGFLILAFVMISGFVTGIFLGFAGYFAFLIPVVLLCGILWPIFGSLIASMFVAVCTETVVLAISVSAARTTGDDLTWPIIGAIAATLATAVLHERMNYDPEEEK